MLQALEREPEDAPSRTLATSTEVSDDDRVSHNLCFKITLKTAELLQLGHNLKGMGSRVGAVVKALTMG